MPRKATGNPTGRPPYEPTDDDRKAVELMTACGLNQTQVARQLGDGGISENTLVKYFREELDTAVDKANMKMAATAFNKGLSGDAQMIRYWMNCRAGWKETSVQEHTGRIETIERIFIDGPAADQPVRLIDAEFEVVDG